MEDGRQNVAADQLNALHDIRSMMERSSRFISLSGLSGVMAGVMALIGAAIAFYYLNKTPFDGRIILHREILQTTKWGLKYYEFFALLGSAVIISALAFGIFFTTRKAKRKGQKVWDKLTFRLLINLAIPLATGAIFCFALLYYGLMRLTPGATLVFYGLALVNASKYTLPYIRYLGISEIILGLIAIFVLEYGLEFWAIGFGVLHIIYGILMYNIYDRRE